MDRRSGRKRDKGRTVSGWRPDELLHETNWKHRARESRTDKDLVNRWIDLNCLHFRRRTLQQSLWEWWRQRRLWRGRLHSENCSIIWLRVSWTTKLITSLDDEIFKSWPILLRKNYRSGLWFIWWISWKTPFWLLFVSTRIWNRLALPENTIYDKYKARRRRMSRDQIS